MILLTTFIWIVSIIVTMTVTDLGTLMAVLGAIGVTVLTFILPRLFYWFVDGIDCPWLCFCSVLCRNDFRSKLNQNLIKF